jgi:hypothetical protein
LGLSPADFINGVTDLAFDEPRGHALVGRARSADQRTAPFDQSVLYFFVGRYNLTNHSAVKFQINTLRFDWQSTNELLHEVILSI